MKTIRMGLLALAAITGIGGAFASSHKKPVGGTTYYAKRNGSEINWVTSKPSSPCGGTSEVACTITSTSTNVTSLNNQFPAQYTVVSGPGEAHN